MLIITLLEAGIKGFLADNGRRRFLFKRYPWVYAIIANKSLKSLQRLAETPLPTYRLLSAFKRVSGLVYRNPMDAATPPPLTNTKRNASKLLN